MEFVLLSTTSKHNNDILRLPSWNILNQNSENFLISSKRRLREFIKNSNNEIVFLADCEKKQGLSIYDELMDEDVKVLDYEPNDLTMEAADLAILNYVGQRISEKSIGMKHCF